tara:strand:- start:183916 stop:184368 length:453 start_codon:yes stop_codon:yes gene_type:complete
MKLTKEKIINLIIILGIGVVLFTPTGFELKVILNRFLSFSPTELKSDDQRVLLDYNWQLSSQDRVAHNFNEYNDKVVVLNFWATWCPPCVAEMPSFQKLYNDYGDRVTFLFLATDEEEKVASFLKKNNTICLCLMLKAPFRRHFFLKLFQ